MEFAAYFRPWDRGVDPAGWAAARESEGFAAIGVGDHFAVGGQGCLHAFPVLAQMATTTVRTHLFPAFGNNLVRSPVEFAQLARTMQVLSGGRFEAGLGAGWDRREMEHVGIAFPPGPQRARRLREAVMVVRELLHGGCRFEGEFYRIDVDEIGPPMAKPPPLFAALGGAWTLQHIGPLVDRIEVFANAPAFRAGTTNFAALATVARDDFRQLIDLARTANPTAAVGAGFFVGVGDGPQVRRMADGFGDGFCRGLAGPAELVASTLLDLAEDLDRISLLTPFPGDLEALTPLLLSR